MSDKTKIGAYVSITGAIITFTLNWFYIPIYGFMASAVTTLIVYGFMAILTYVLGQKYYPIQYPVAKVLMYVFIAVGVYFISTFLPYTGFLKYTIHTLLLVAYIGFAYLLEKKNFKLLKS